jgi:hypothetical protein
VLLVAILGVVCTALLTLATAPKEVTVAALGSGWQCSRTALVVTTCTHAHRTQPMMHNIQPRERVVLRPV